MNRSIESQFQTYNNEFVSMTNVDGSYDDTILYLGKIDAEKEWNDNPEAAYKKFCIQNLIMTSFQTMH